MSWETNGSTWTRVSSQWLRKNVSAKSIYTPTSHNVEFSANIRQSWQSRYRTSDQTAVWKRNESCPVVKNIELLSMTENVR